MNNSVLDRDQWQLLKDGKRIRVYQSRLEDGSPVVLKVYELDSFFQRLSFSRKRRTLTHFYRDMDHQLRLPHLIDSGFSAGKKQGFLCYPFLSGQDFRQVPWDNLAETERTGLMGEAGRILGKLHREGWIHSDFKFGNLFRAGPAVYLLDLESARRNTGLSARSRDLARFLLNGVELGLKDSTLEVFWQSYKDHCGQKPEAALTQTVNHWLEKLARRHEKYQRPEPAGRLTFLQSREELPEQVTER